MIPKAEDVAALEAVRRRLAGRPVVALKQAVAAPFATCQLADLGARVIKIERPSSATLPASTTAPCTVRQATSSGSTAARRASSSTSRTRRTLWCGSAMTSWTYVNTRCADSPRQGTLHGSVPSMIMSISISGHRSIRWMLLPTGPRSPTATPPRTRSPPTCSPVPLAFYALSRHPRTPRDGSNPNPD